MSTPLPEQTKNNSKFLTIMSVLAGLQVIAGSVTMLEAVPSDVGGALFIIVAAINAGVTYYLNGNIVPLKNVVAYQPSKDGDGYLYAGGASVEDTGNYIPAETTVGHLAERYVDDEPTDIPGEV